MAEAPATAPVSRTQARALRRKGRNFERRIASFTILLAAIAILFGAALIWQTGFSLILRICLFLVLTLILGSIGALLYESITQPLRGLANIVEAYRGGDYTVRGRRTASQDALGELVNEVNSLGRTLHEQRLRTLEATALLDKLVATIDVAVLAFDGQHRLSLLNPAAERLLGVASARRARGLTAAELAVEELLAGEGGTSVATSVAGRTGRWQVTHGMFREGGVAQHLLIIADLRQALREEERAAWQRLIRVIGHEVNNSLTPIKSLADTLVGLLAEALPGGPAREDALGALQVIGDRTDSLSRFLAQYSRLARLPAPRRRWVAMTPLLSRIAALDHTHAIEVVSDPRLEARIDEDQIEQALINLVKNAAEAQQGARGRIGISAQNRNSVLTVAITDDGPGIANTDNLFVPFFTTKPGGSGVGLALSRQIVEGHGGTLALENRSDARGAVATLQIPAAARG
jgi:nitrogen fixation/metabolism regulation signal transduction histidine kinase